ncbi:hypothetical protein [Streptomyces sp. NPDC007088]|uniref:hypothetical protein n=1 Tax=Streptomyces sp. NPDC007088 TaxID=3364773 RepID=UPI0036828B31
MAALLLAGCGTTSTPADTSSRQPGHALALEETADGTVSNNYAHKGQVWLLGFPPMGNASKSPITITGAHVSQVPDGLHLLGYVAFDERESKGRALLAYEGDPDDVDYRKLKNYAENPYKIPPRKNSRIYYMARVQVVGKIKGHVGECSIYYQRNGVRYEQKAGCDIVLRLRTQKPWDL